MNISKGDIIGWSILILVVIGFFSLVWFVEIKPTYEENKLCAEELNLDYNFWTWNEVVKPINFNYRYIDREHYNCCWAETKLNEDGYYIKELCKGFTKGE